MPDTRPPVSPDWQRDCRRIGGGIMTVTFLAGSAWVSASRTFITLKSGVVVHPSPFGWLLWVCLAGLILGLYVVLSTYFDWLPMPGRQRPVNHDTMYSLTFQGPSLFVLRGGDMGRGKVAVRVALVLGNSGSRPIRAELRKYNLIANGATTDFPGSPMGVTTMRLLPGQQREFRANYLMGQYDNSVFAGAATYEIEYGPPSGYPAYRRTHSVAFATTYPLNAAYPPAADWWDLTAEEDEVVASVPDLPQSLCRRRPAMSEVVVDSGRPHE